MSREAMQMALEALEDANDVARMEFSDEDYYSEAINAPRQALVDADDTSQKRVDEKAKREQEPVAEIQAEDMGKPFNAIRVTVHFYAEVPAVGTKLYTAPPKREWVGLTDEEIYDCEEEVEMPQYEISSADLYAFARAIEAKLKEKSHG